jgi:DNA-binding NtrC family response regulator
MFMVTDRTVTEHVPDSAARIDRRPELGVLVVHCRGPVVPQPYAIARVSTFGREGVDIVLDDAGVSRAHGRFEQRGSALLVSDLGSRNGTFVNGEPVGAEGKLAPPGSVVRAGKTLFAVADVGAYRSRRPGELPGLLGGAALDDARFCIDAIGPSKSSVLVLGETGTGKEVVAGLLHAVSGRPGPFVALNCAAVPSELVDAELFGHTRGAFSGAAQARIGLFRAAHGGTLFLDEIAEMPAMVQAKLLRTLETEEVRAVGEDRPVKVDVRVVAATNRNVDEMIESGSFRGDLLHRLAGFRIALPPLRLRNDDVPVLAESFLAASGFGISAPALERLMMHPWPGNVRELKNAVTSAAEVARKRGRNVVEADDVAPLLGPVSVRPEANPEESTLAGRISAALTSTKGDVATAAGQLGMSRSVLYETLRRLRIDPRTFRSRS